MSSTTQSWTAWLLDSYASSVSPVTTDSSYRHHDESHSISEPSSYDPHSSSQSPMSSVSNSSAYGPYVRTGRGGAGNFTWQTELKPAKPTSPIDLEAQPQQQHTSLAARRKAAAKLENINTIETMRLRQSSAQYLSVGRGGAGNYAANNADIKEAKRSPSLPASFNSRAPVTPKPGTASPGSAYPIHPGRGGAGNYAAATEARTRGEGEKDAEERLAAEQRRGQIIEEVDGLLPPPPGAWLGGGRRKSESMYEDV